MTFIVISLCTLAMAVVLHLELRAHIRATEDALRRAHRELRDAREQAALLEFRFENLRKRVNINLVDAAAQVSDHK